MEILHIEGVENLDFFCRNYLDLILPQFSFSNAPVRPDIYTKLLRNRGQS